MANNTSLKTTYNGSSYETTIYVPEDVFNKLMKMNYSGFVSIAGEKLLSLGGMRFKQDKYLPKNTILTPNPKEVKRLQKERYEKMLGDLERLGNYINFKIKKEF